MEPESKPDFCCHCKHLLGKRHSPESAEAWRCYNPGNIEGKQYDLVTGAQITYLKCENIRTARGTEDKCMGFELYEPPVHAPTIPNYLAPSNQSNSTSNSLNKLKAKLKNIGVNDL